MPRPDLLDTNLLVHWIRGSPLWDRVRDRYQPLGASARTLISVVTVGELQSLALQFRWGGDKLDQMQFLLQHMDAVSIDAPEILMIYAVIDSQAARIGRPLGKNDAWIAATATATGAVLLTTDRDFDRIDLPGFSHHCIDLDGASQA